MRAWQNGNVEAVRRRSAGSLGACALLAIVVTSCAPAPRTTKVELTSPPVLEGQALIYSRYLDELLPGMSAEGMAAREQPQQTWEKLCFEVGRPGMERPRAELCVAMCSRLGPATPKTGRVWILRQLERLDGDESVPYLTALLNEQDDELRDLARRALQKNPSDAAGGALRSALQQAREPVWQAALCNALGARRDEASVPMLTQVACGTDPSVAKAAIAALADIGSPVAETRLREMSKSLPAELRAMVADARLRCADQLVARGQKEAAAKTYEELSKPDCPVQIRCGALRGLVAVGGREMTTRLLATVRDPRDQTEFALRSIAADLLTDIRDPDLVRLLYAAEQRGSPPPDGAVVLLAGVLSQQGDPAADASVMAMLKSQNAEVRLAAVRGLANAVAPDAALVLARAAATTEGSAAERDAARKSLARLRGEGVDAAIVTALKDADVPLRVELLRGLSARRAKSAVPVLLEQTRQPEEPVRVAAITALGELAPASEAGTLVSLLVAADNDAVRKAAEDAVVAVCGRSADPQSRAAPLLAIESAPNPVAQAALVRALGRVGGNAALERIRAAVKADNAQIKDSAVRALADWAEPSVLNDLLDIAEHSDNPTHRVLALRGAVRLLALPADRDAAVGAAMCEKAFTLAQSPDEKKLVLAAVAKVPHVSTLKLAEGCLTDDALRAEAEAAVVPIAQAVAMQHRDEARDALEKVAGETKNGDLRRSARQTLDTIRKIGGCVTAWRVCGPYLEAGKDWMWVFDHAFPPEQPGHADVAWRTLPTTSTEQPWVFDLTKVGSGADCCVYVRSAVWSEKPQEARLETGSDDGLKVWLNDRVVHEARVSRGYAPAQDKIPITLTAGWNTVMLKVVQVGGGWAFSCIITGPDGNALDGLKLSADEPAPAQ